MHIAVDAMGGDNAPGVVIQGALQATIETGIDIVLVGDSKAISPALNRCRGTEKVRIHHCDEVVLMDESPLKAVRNKQDSSIMTAFDLLKKGEVDAVVSAGNSGATMAAGILKLGKIEGVERPAIACIIPGENGIVILIDAGGNVDCRPVHLLQFGIMANAFASSCMGIQEPRVGLLSIGRCHAIVNKDIKSPDLLFIHKIFRLEILHLARYLRRKCGRIKPGDGTYAGFSGANSLPILFHSGSQGSHHADSCDYNPSLHIHYSLLSLSTEKHFELIIFIRKYACGTYAIKLLLSAYSEPLNYRQLS